LKLESTKSLDLSTIQHQIANFGIKENSEKEDNFSMITSIEEQRFINENCLMQTIKSEFTEKNRNKKIIESGECLKLQD